MSYLSHDFSQDYPQHRLSAWNTLQVVGQKKVEPTAASLLLSMESVFSVLAGWVILGQKLSARELLGCALMFAAVICVQLPDKKKTKQVETA